MVLEADDELLSFRVFSENMSQEVADLGFGASTLYFDDLSAQSGVAALFWTGDIAGVAGVEDFHARDSLALDDVLQK